MARPFIKGLQLSELFYSETVQPLMAKHFASLAYSAALIGPGSEVLGYDDPQSTDHNWGPRLLLFLHERDQRDYAAAIDQMLRDELPHAIHGYPVNYAHAGDDGVGDGPVDHSVTIHTVAGYFDSFLTFDPRQPISAKAWLNTPEQTLLMLTSGRVFHDGLGQLEPIRARLHYYPHDLWLYLLAAQWKRIAEERAFLGRCGQVGDELGSRLVAARLVRDLMRLCFLMEHQYAPYIKWFGTAFARLGCADRLLPIFQQVLSAERWPARENPLNAAYSLVAQLHNDLQITPPLPTEVVQYYTRPFRVIPADDFVTALRNAIHSAEVLALPDHLGGVDQYVDSTDAFNYLASGQLQIQYRVDDTNCTENA